MASIVFYNSFKTKLLSQANAIDFDSDTIKVALTTSSYTPDIDSHDFFNDVTNEISGTGYTAGGAAISSKAVTQDNTDNEGVFDGADVSWASSSLTARYAVIYKDTGTASTSPLIGYVDFGVDQNTNGSTLTLTWASEGIINIT